ncbi:unnamed protein product [Vitrella brassicaformis CCMP3155]|uniref:Uncharacterized protein n=2 Tax=Vitrella brassicaformis TaxID=1169539 RepID=A0A0G4H5B7_VITBC|nr:unnamed protein product [Vitrella brassicaformis CCMP3155]|mmetsp:Transcript_7871/g.19384  ORF Transcript_7871/g.19384 Transcript_7871/m.19384 type:complete len:320 (+) Transcript_7871:35-994(+)|eukprot:CEM38980.1 unnamed protein product [Vitrella brassicaformis CCMP3155]
MLSVLVLVIAAARVALAISASGCTDNEDSSCSTGGGFASTFSDHSEDKYGAWATDASSDDQQGARFSLVLDSIAHAANLTAAAHKMSIMAHNRSAMAADVSGAALAAIDKGSTSGSPGGSIGISSFAQDDEEEVEDYMAHRGQTEVDLKWFSTKWFREMVAQSLVSQNGFCVLPDIGTADDRSRSLPTRQCAYSCPENGKEKIIWWVHPLQGGQRKMDVYKVHDFKCKTKAKRQWCTDPRDNKCRLWSFKMDRTGDEPGDTKVATIFVVGNVTQKAGSSLACKGMEVAVLPTWSTVDPGRHDKVTLESARQFCSELFFE